MLFRGTFTTCTCIYPNPPIPTGSMLQATVIQTFSSLESLPDRFNYQLKCPGDKNQGFFHRNYWILGYSYAVSCEY